MTHYSPPPLAGIAQRLVLSPSGPPAPSSDPTFKRPPASPSAPGTVPIPRKPRTSASVSAPASLSSSLTDDRDIDLPHLHHHHFAYLSDPHRLRLDRRPGAADDDARDRYQPDDALFFSDASDWELDLPATPREQQQPRTMYQEHDDDDDYDDDEEEEEGEEEEEEEEEEEDDYCPRTLTQPIDIPARRERPGPGPGRGGVSARSRVSSIVFASDPCGNRRGRNGVWIAPDGGIVPGKPEQVLSLQRNREMFMRTLVW